MLDIDRYMEQIVGLLLQEFGSRLIYVGLQGSYRRGETDAGSDIDVMTVLDELQWRDLERYREVIRQTSCPDKSCGFLCGKKELANWNACEICQLVHETKDCYGKLKPLVPSYTLEDVREQIKITVGNLYHALCHQTVHAEAPADLAVFYKSAFYILQNLTYYRTGQYVLTKKELLPRLTGRDHAVLETALALKKQAEYEPDRIAELLFYWCQETLWSI